MDVDRKLFSQTDLETRRALQLDALVAILPMDRRDGLVQLLTDDDVETLKHLAREGIGENTLKALASDLAYLDAGARAATATPLPWPATEGSFSSSSLITSGIPSSVRPTFGTACPRT